MDERSIDELRTRAENPSKLTDDSIKDDARGLERTDCAKHGKPADYRRRHAMTRAELIALASPPCHECGAPVQRVEAKWHLDEDYRWRPGPNFMVCGNAHRVLVKPVI